jgi:photosystem II stability/assembly factor-like uncharacterized protein
MWIESQRAIVRFFRQGFGQYSWLIAVFMVFGLVQMSVVFGQGWTSIGPGADYVKVIRIDPLTPSILYAGLVYERGDYPAGGVYKSVDGGKTWNSSSTGIPTNHDIFGLAIDPVTPSTLYAGDWAGGVYKSTDSGSTWSLTTELNPVYTIVIDPKAPSTVYAGMDYDRGLYKSIDGGNTWNALTEGMPSDFSAYAIAVDPNTSSTVYVGVDGGVYKSTDGGNHWTAMSSGVLAGSTVLALAINPVTPSTVYAATAGNLVFVSGDGGSTWTNSSTGLPNVEGLHDLKIDPVSPTTLYAAAFFGGVYKSTDSGATWNPMNTDLTDLTVHSIALLPTNPADIYIGTCNSGVFFFSANTTVPGMPSGLTATPGNGQVSLSWTTPLNNGGAAITGYQVQVATLAGGPYTNVASCPANSTLASCIATGLANGTTYFFRVAAVNEAGAGAYSLNSNPAVPLKIVRSQLISPALLR